MDEAIAKFAAVVSLIPGWPVNSSGRVEDMALMEFTSAQEMRDHHKKVRKKFFPNSVPVKGAAIVETARDLANQRMLAALQDENAILKQENRHLKTELDALKSPCEQENLTIRKILQVVGKFYGISRIDIVSNRRFAALMRPRLVAYYLARTLTKHGYVMVGRHLGRRDHTTILSGYKKVLRDIQTDAQLRAEISVITTILREEGYVIG